MRPDVRSRIVVCSVLAWWVDVARFLGWLLMTASVAVGSACSGRPTVLHEWLAIGPPSRRVTADRPVAVTLEAARGVAEMEAWLRAGGQPAEGRGQGSRDGDRSEP